MTDFFDPYLLLGRARKGALSHGQVEALTVYIRGLERQIQHHRDFQNETSADRSVRVCLNNDSSGLLVEYPGATSHTVSLPLARPDLAIEFLTRSLRERRGLPAFIASPGAPTQADLEALAKASKKAPRKVGTIANLEVTLEDLGL